MQNIDSTKDPFVDLLVTLDVFDRSYQKALDRLSLKSEDNSDQGQSFTNSLQHATIYEYMGKKDLAEKYYDNARSILESKIEKGTEEALLHSRLGISYAGLGRKEDAIREGKLAVEQVSNNAQLNTHRVVDLSRIYVMVGEHDKAIDQLEHLLSIPGPLSIPLLQLNPAWDPLLNHPRFKKLIESTK
jgi:tetratricopeptide (TPR) repeat protein